MLGDVWNWLISQGWEVSSHTIAVAALIIAVLALRESRRASRDTKASNLSQLRIQAREALAEANQSYLSLTSQCQANEAAWGQHIRNHHAPLSRHVPPGSDACSACQKRGSELLRDLRKGFKDIDELGSKQLETKIAEAKLKAYEIANLSLELEQPPQR